jgi:hypothetical protein
LKCRNISNPVCTQDPGPINTFHIEQFASSLLVCIPKLSFLSVHTTTKWTAAVHQSVRPPVQLWTLLLRTSTGQFSSSSDKLPVSRDTWQLSKKVTIQNSAALLAFPVLGTCPAHHSLYDFIGLFNEVISNSAYTALDGTLNK